VRSVGDCSCLNVSSSSCPLEKLGVKVNLCLGIPSKIIAWLMSVHQEEHLHKRGEDKEGRYNFQSSLTAPS